MIVYSPSYVWDVENQLASHVAVAHRHPETASAAMVEIIKEKLEPWDEFPSAIAVQENGVYITCGYAVIPWIPVRFDNVDMSNKVVGSFIPSDFGIGITGYKAAKAAANHAVFQAKKYGVTLNVKEVEIKINLED